MRIAAIADIHGILPGLQVALEEISSLGVEGLVVVGDMVAGPNPGEVIDRLSEWKCWMIQGNNEDYALKFASGQAPGWWFTSRQWAFIRWNYEQLSDQALEFLRSLPEQRSLELEGVDPIRVVHGSPRGLSDLIYPDCDVSTLDAVLAEVPEPLVIFGHTHEDWQMQRLGKLALNPGSVSMSFRGEHCGTYSILSWENGCWQAETHRIHYDFELVKRAYIESGLLEAGNFFARSCLASIKTGINYLPPMMQYAYQRSAQAGYGGSPFVPDPIWDEACALFEEQHYKGVL